MPRPKLCRRVCLRLGCTYFKPAGIPVRLLEEVVLSVDELESLRLIDLEGLYHEQAADAMGVSRRTFGRVLENARRKVAQALIGGLALRIEGGAIEAADSPPRQLTDCVQGKQIEGVGDENCGGID